MFHIKTIKKAENKVDLWYYNVKSKTLKTNFLAEFLSHDERHKVNQFKFQIDKERAFYSRGILRLLLSQYLDIPPKHIEFEYGAFGKPRLKHESSIQFNVSHSGDYIAIALTRDYDIGVDIEKIKNDFDILDIAKNFFSEKEINSLTKLPKEDLVKGFYRCWTRKESFIKAKSKGLSFPLDTFSVSVQNDKIACLEETKWDNAEKDSWSLFSFSLDKDYIGAVSVQGLVESIEYYNFNDFITTDFT